MVSWLSADQKSDGLAIYLSVIIPAKKGRCAEPFDRLVAGNEAVLLNYIAGDGFETRHYTLASRTEFGSDARNRMEQLCMCARARKTRRGSPTGSGLAIR